MIANAFSQYKDDDRVIIFASGVSNSKETDETEFQREENLLKSLDKNKLLIYFSTCSMYDPTLQNTPYVRHKICMEYIVKHNFKRSIIFRLPNVVGKTTNTNTFFSHFKENINKESEIKVDLLASRYLIDIDDLSNILSGIINKHKNEDVDIHKKICVAFNNREMVTDIVDMMMYILGKKSPIVLTHKGCDFQFDKSEFDIHLKEIGYILPENYTYNLLKKYLI